MAGRHDPLLPLTETLRSRTTNGLPLYRFRLLGGCPGLQHAVFTRLGGVSSAPFASLNVSYGTQDDAGKVRENLRRVRAATGNASLVYGRQVHGGTLLAIHEHLPLDPEIPYPLEGVDGFISSVPGLTMMVKVADCQGVLLFDPRRRVAAAVHAGWRGSVQNVVGKAVRLMAAEFQCRPADLIAGISPSLGPCCAEFRNWRHELPEHFLPYQVRPTYFDFWAISRAQLMEAGVPGENIEIAGLCTRCHPDVFYSYRGEGQTGRSAVTIGVEE
jgi:purine-nucleoside/S-methyl-5'-thioadenosine phosphorylase / adenosine deaminase